MTSTRCTTRLLNIHQSAAWIYNCPLCKKNKKNKKTLTIWETLSPECLTCGEKLRRVLLLADSETDHGIPLNSHFFLEPAASTKKSWPQCENHNPVFLASAAVNVRNLTLLVTTNI